MKEALNRLNHFIQIIPEKLNQIDLESFNYKPEENKWSIKEILGHLIDSASNNHHRLVRAQFEDNPIILYNQDEWCKYNYYQFIEKDQIINLWIIYNKQLVQLIDHIPTHHLIRFVNNVTLEFIIKDYVKHLEHHLNQIISMKLRN